MRPALEVWGGAVTALPRAKYRPLAWFLTAQPPEVHEVTLTFVALERLIGAPLPAGAYTATFWTNTRETSQGRHWLAVGWRRGRVLLRRLEPEVTFVRVETCASPYPHPAESGPVTEWVRRKGPSEERRFAQREVLATLAPGGRLCRC